MYVVYCSLAAKGKGTYYFVCFTVHPGFVPELLVSIGIFVSRGASCGQTAEYPLRTVDN